VIQFVPMKLLGYNISSAVYQANKPAVQSPVRGCVAGVAPLTVSQACYICAKLSGVRLLLTEAGRAGLLQRIRLNVSQDDVLFALRDSDAKKT